MSCEKKSRSDRGTEPMQCTYLKSFLQLPSVLRTPCLTNLDELDNSITAPPCAFIGSFIVLQNLLCGFIQHGALTPSIVCVANIIAQRAREARYDRLVVSCEVVQFNRFVDTFFALGLTGSPEQDLVRVV